MICTDACFEVCGRVLEQDDSDTSVVGLEESLCSLGCLVVTVVINSEEEKISGTCVRATDGLELQHVVTPCFWQHRQPTDLGWAVLEEPPLPLLRQ